MTLNEQVLGQQIEFPGVAPQQLKIAIHIAVFDRSHRHAPLDPPPERSLLVRREIVGCLAAQKRDEFGQPVRCAVHRRPVMLGGENHSPLISHKRVGNLRHRKHQVHRACHDGAFRHAVIAGFVRVLRNDQPGVFLHRFEPDGAVGPGSREDDADRARAVGIRQRMQQEIEGQTRSVARFRARKLKMAAADGQIGSGRDDIDMLPLDRHSIHGLLNGHRRMTRQQVHHHAFMGRIEMLDQDERHAAGGGNCIHELSAGVQAARRGSYPNDREIIGVDRRGVCEWSGAPRYVQRLLLH